MGYPSEIPNAFPDPPPPPVESGWIQALRRLWAGLSAPFRRRPQRRTDHPERYQQGVNRNAPPIHPGASAGLDFDQIGDALTPPNDHRPPPSRD